jgi:molybdopterin biosynthesis enzyme
MSNLYKMIPVNQAQQIVLENCWVLGSETIPAEEAIGRVLSAQVVAHDALPPFPASIKVISTFFDT